MIKLTFSSELTSAILGGVGGGLFFMSSKTSANINDTQTHIFQIYSNIIKAYLLEFKNMPHEQCLPLSLRFSSAIVLVSVRTLSVAACISL